ncbi:hypothetical protein N7449_005860 [Penicillium cf. viridicatum]|uniref:Uncharacterized protein n=1 Tax=Penicillium cf. viridicatum TaxID=2972119 RepID=A0A9W9MGX1_9EURO|nr:hypothetical protein N7449_005860 [Penicillium cf. viridicatum]
MIMASRNISAWLLTVCRKVLDRSQSSFRQIHGAGCLSAWYGPLGFAEFSKKPCMSGVKSAAHSLPDAQQVTATEFQGGGPHKDGLFLTYLLQGMEHSSLEHPRSQVP